MIKRVHIVRVSEGRIVLPPGEARHVRTVLRLGVGDPLEVFDSTGATGAAKIVEADEDVIVEVAGIAARDAEGFRWTVASAIPKGPRADWMIEKLSELGTETFAPLNCARSVVVPGGKGKTDRWERLATESAKQSRRAGVMRVEPVASLSEFLATVSLPAWYLSTAAGAMPAQAAAQAVIAAHAARLAMLIGPEGGWTDDEVSAMEKAGLTGVSLGATILRIETAAVAAATLAAAIVAPAIRGQQ